MMSILGRLHACVEGRKKKKKKKKEESDHKLERKNIRQCECGVKKWLIMCLHIYTKH